MVTRPKGLVNYYKDVTVSSRKEVKGQKRGGVNLVIFISLPKVRASLVAQMVKNLPAMRETWVRSLGWEDPLEKGMATHSSTSAWRIPMDRGAWRATVHGVTKSQTQLSD